MVAVLLAFQPLLVLAEVALSLPHLVLQVRHRDRAGAAGQHQDDAGPLPDQVREATGGLAEAWS